MKKWNQLLEPMITWMNSNKEHFIQAGLDSFCVIFEKSDDRIHLLVPKMMKVLYQMFTREDVYYCSSFIFSGQRRNKGKNFDVTLFVFFKNFLGRRNKS